MWQFNWQLALVLSISVFASAVCSICMCAYLLHRLSKKTSWRSLQELSLQVADHSSLLELLTKQLKRVNARTGGRPSAVSSEQQLPMATVETPAEWKTRMRRQMAANQLAGRHPAAGIGQEDAK